MTLNSGRSVSVSELLPPQDQAHLFQQVHILDGLDCHLATATVSSAQESWAVITDQAPSLQTFARYGQRFGGIEPHFKDYKSAALGLPNSRLRTVEAGSPIFCVM